MPMEMGRNLEHTTERLTEGLRCPWKWGQWQYIDNASAMITGQYIDNADSSKSLTTLTLTAKLE